MSQATRNSSSTGLIYPKLARTRSLVNLWMLRMLVNLDAVNRLNLHMPSQQRKRIVERLGIPDMFRKLGGDELACCIDRLEATLEHLERSKRKFVLPNQLAANLDLLGSKLSLNSVDRQLLGLAVLLTSDEDVHNIGKYCIEMVNTTQQIHLVTGLSLKSIRHATSCFGMLRKSGLVEFSYQNGITQNIRLQRGGFRSLATTKITQIDSFFNTFLNLSPPAVLDVGKYRHINPSFEFLASLINESIATHRKGNNILIYGPPGTGKTELTRVLAKQLGMTLYDVSNVEYDGEWLKPHERLSNAATAQALLVGRRAVLVFDEVDAIFNDGSSLFGKPTTAESAKSWVNQLLEENAVPTIWIANSVSRMDHAFIRRFDAVVHLQAPPFQQRAEQLRLATNGLLDEANIQRMAISNSLTPAIIARACSVATRVSTQKQSMGTVIESLLDNTLRAQGHPTIKDVNRGQNSQGFDPLFCNTAVDLAGLANGLQQSNAGRVCLYGPPGTGKSAFGHWLASSLGKPLVLKRMSDLQSPYLGVMERNLANAFEDAIRDQAILQIDEVDSFLRNRESAKQAWEISQVNEFLTQLESFEGIFIATTNLVDGLDPAALRRFDHKIHVGYLRSEQLRNVIDGKLNEWGLGKSLESDVSKGIAGLSRVSMGDIAALSRRHRISAFKSTDEFLEALTEEVRLKGGVVNRMGFV